jgi:hypothetical protein
MRLTIDIPAKLLDRARVQAAGIGQTLDEYLISALPPPSIEGPPNMSALTREQTDEAMFG